MEKSSITFQLAEKQLNNKKPCCKWLIAISMVVTALDLAFGHLTEGLKALINRVSEALVMTFGSNLTKLHVDLTYVHLGEICLVIAVLLWALVAIYEIARRQNKLLGYAIGIALVAFGSILSDMEYLVGVGFGFVLLSQWSNKRVPLKRVMVSILFVIGICILSRGLGTLGTTPVIDDLIYGKGEMNGGQITRAGEFKKTDQERLVVSMKKPQSFYLRGYVGETFEKGNWKKLSGREKAKFRDEFYWLHSQGYYGTSLAAKSAMSVMDEKLGEVKIHNVGESRKYAFIPYEYAGNSQLDGEYSLGDEAIRTRGIGGLKDYSYEITDNIVVRYPSIISKLKNSKQNDARKKEAVINTYAYKEYLKLSKEEKETIESALGSFSLSENNKHLEYSKAKGSIVDYLSKHITYSEKAQDYDEDFLREFLQENCKGYSVHYATAATLMFRYYGIPARYVEGYIITPEEKASQIILSGKNAHAWVEYYQDGIGWMPFEVTTPYMEKMEKADILKSMPKEKKQEDKPKPEKKKNKDDNIQRNQEEQPQIINWLWGGFILALLILGLAYCLIRRRIIRNRRKEIFERENNQIVVKLYMYLIKTADSFDTCLVDFCNREEYDRTYGIYQKARYSNIILEETEILEMRQFVTSTLKEIFGNLKMHKKILWKCVLFIDYMEK